MSFCARSEMLAGRFSTKSNPSFLPVQVHEGIVHSEQYLLAHYTRPILIKP
jgi:hypothetical protein